MSSDQPLSAEGRACLAWFSRLPFFQHQGQDITLETLADGGILWEALQELNPNYFSGDLPSQAQSAGALVNNIQNIKHVYKQLYKYITDVSKSPLPHGPGTIDTRLIAEGYDGEETAKLLKWIFVAASNSVDNHEFMATVMDMSEEHQKSLMAIILGFGQQEQDSQAEGEKSPHDTSRSDIPIDNELRNEEVYGRLAAENSRLEREKKELQKDLRDFSNRINRLQENNNELVVELRTAQDQARQSATTSDSPYRIKDLEAKIQDRDDHIAAQEAQLAEYDSEKAALKTESNKLRKANEKLEPMQDQVDELRHERDSLIKKNNALERYRAKVQSVQEIEIENKELRRELEELRDSSRDGDDVRDQNIHLQREASELKSLMANTEIQLVEAQTRRKQIEYENAQLRDQADAARQQHEQDVQNIYELEGRLNTSVPGASGLDLELAKSENEDVKR
jgi:protein HOOK3